MDGLERRYKVKLRKKYEDSIDHEILKLKAI